jgi:DNA-binding MarR family transcriptional regulator
MGTIREEIRQTKPFESPADEAVVTLLATADRVRTALSGVTEARSVTLQQYNVLRILRGAGPAGLPTLDVAGRMIERSPGITRLLDRLEARGLVRRERCPEDRRQVLCRGTERARRALADLDGPLAEAIRSSLAPLDAARTADLVRLLDAVRAAAGSFRAHGTPIARDERKTAQNRRKKEKTKP